MMTNRLKSHGGPVQHEVRGVTQGNPFCVACGDPPPLTDERLCETCFRARNHLSEFPERIQQTRCPKCEMILVDGRFGRMGHDELMQHRAMESLTVHPDAKNLDLELHAEIIDDRTTKLTMDVKGDIQGIDFDDHHESLLQTSNGVCQTCTRKAGAYFEAVMQLRSAGRRLEEKEVKELRESLDHMMEDMPEDPMFFITKEGPVTGGWDLQLGSKSMARMWGRKLVNAHGGQTKETSTTVGHKDGVDITRLTLLYRKPAYGIGDIIRFRKRLWRIDTWQKDGPILLAMDRYERTGATWRDLEKCIVVSQKKDHCVVEILRRDDSAVEILDPNDFTVRTLSSSYDIGPEDSRVRICLIEGEWTCMPRTRGEQGGE